MFDRCTGNYTSCLIYSQSYSWFSPYFWFSLYSWFSPHFWFIQRWILLTFQDNIRCWTSFTFVALYVLFWLFHVLCCVCLFSLSSLCPWISFLLFPLESWFVWLLSLSLSLMTLDKCFKLSCLKIIWFKIVMHK